jgi:hypothetical protein
MKEYALMKKFKKTLKNAEKNANYKKIEMMEKHEKRAKSHLKISNELNNVSKQEMKNMILREESHYQNVESTVIAKLEELNIRKETN